MLFLSNRPAPPSPNPALRRQNFIGLAFCAPLLVIILGLVVYPLGSAVYMAFLSRDETAFVGLANFQRLLHRDVFWQVVWQSWLIALAAVACKVTLGLAGALLLNALRGRRGQEVWHAVFLIPWVMPLSLAVLGWWWLFEPTYSSLNWLLVQAFNITIPWLSEPGWARASVILVNVWSGTPFFILIYLAALRMLPHELYEASALDGASAGQQFFHITLPLLRPVIALTIAFSLIITLASFEAVQILTRGGPLGTTEIFATYAYKAGIEAGDLPMGAAVSVCMLPILIPAIVVVTRGIRRGAI